MADDLKDYRLPPNPPEAERLCEALWPAIDAAEALLEAHEAEQFDCVLCEDARGLLYVMRLVESGLSMNLLSWPAEDRRRALESRRRGDPRAAEALEAGARAEEAAAAPPVEAPAANPFYPAGLAR
jgi:hypothetical protein